MSNIEGEREQEEEACSYAITIKFSPETPNHASPDNSPLSWGNISPSTCSFPSLYLVFREDFHDVIQNGDVILTKNSPVNVELVKIRTIFELTGGKDSRDPWNIESIVLSSILANYATGRFSEGKKSRTNHKGNFVSTRLFDRKIRWKLEFDCLIDIFRTRGGLLISKVCHRWWLFENLLTAFEIQLVVG